MDLLVKALDVRQRAYAPYSGYKVGAALESEGGVLYTGCNVENLAYGSTMCAERNAIFKMVADGEHRFSRIAVATKDGGTPCGACLQVLLEFTDDPSSVEVICGSDAGKVAVYTLSQLLPHGFRSDSVQRTER